MRSRAKRFAIIGPLAWALAGWAYVLTAAWCWRVLDGGDLEPAFWFREQSAFELTVDFVGFAACGSAIGVVVGLVVLALEVLLVVALVFIICVKRESGEEVPQ